MTLKQKIQKTIAVSVKKLFGYDLDMPVVNYPEQVGFGDYATPAAMALAKELKKNPREIAVLLSEELSKDDLFEKIEVAGPGFVNMFLKRGVVEAELRTVLSLHRYGKNDTMSQRSILLEYVSANPTGPLHIGHGRWAAIGDSVARILRFCGAKVATEFYINDAGNQIRLLNESVDAVKKGKDVPENGYHGAYIEDIAKKEGLPSKTLLEMQKETLSRFRVSFDMFFSETSLHDSSFVEDTIRFLKSKELTFEEDGVLWFRTTDFGDDKDRVLIKSDGAYTYFAVDIAYHRNKIERRFGELINVFGADHHGYINRLKAAVRAFSHDVILNIIIGQLVNLYRDGKPVRMSKRTGDMISLDEVIDEIGVDAARYFLVMRKTDSKLDFDLSVAKEQSDSNPVFYVQYAYARICSVLRKAAEEGLEAESVPSNIFDVEQDNIEGENDRSVWELAMKIVSFPDLVIECASSLEPHRMTQYLEDLAGKFHRYYTKYRVVTEDRERSERRLVMLRTTEVILKTGLDLIGVSAPEKM